MPRRGRVRLHARLCGQALLHRVTGPGTTGGRHHEQCLRRADLSDRSGRRIGTDTQHARQGHHPPAPFENGLDFPIGTAYREEGRDVDGSYAYIVSNRFQCRPEATTKYSRGYRQTLLPVEMRDHKDI